MATYIIAEIVLKDSGWLAGYRHAVAALIEKHGGAYVLRSSDAIRIEGSRSPPDLVVVMRFPDRRTAQSFLDDPEYAPHKSARQGSTVSESILVEG